MNDEELNRQIWGQSLKENKIVCAECQKLVITKVYCYWCYSSKRPRDPNDIHIDNLKSIKRDLENALDTVNYKLNQAKESTLK